MLCEPSGLYIDWIHINEALTLGIQITFVRTFSGPSLDKQPNWNGLILQMATENSNLCCITKRNFKRNWHEPYATCTRNYLFKLTGMKLTQSKTDWLSKLTRFNLRNSYSCRNILTAPHDGNSRSPSNRLNVTSSRHKTPSYLSF